MTDKDLAIEVSYDEELKIYNAFIEKLGICTEDKSLDTLIKKLEDAIQLSTTHSKEKKGSFLKKFSIANFTIKTII